MVLSYFREFVFCSSITFFCLLLFELILELGVIAGFIAFFILI